MRGNPLADNHVVDVKSHGAVGNGIANDTTAIQSAINAALGSASPRRVRIGGGAYKITASLIIGSGNGLMSKPLIIEGDGQGTQIINAAPAKNATFRLSSGSYWTLKGLLLTGNSTNPNDGVWVSGAASGLDHPARWHIENVVAQMAGRGFVLSNTNTGVLRSCKSWPSSNSAALRLSQKVALSDISHGIQLTGAFANDISIYDFDAQPAKAYANGMCAIYCDATTSISIRVIGGTLEGDASRPPDKYSIHFRNVQHFLLQSIYAENSQMRFDNARYGVILEVNKAGVGGTEFNNDCIRISTIGGQDDSLFLAAGCNDNLFIRTEYDGKGHPGTQILDHGLRNQFIGVTTVGAPYADRGRNPINFRAVLAGPVPMAGGARTQILHGTSDYDDFGVHSTPTGRFAPGVAGKYRLSVTGRCAGVSPGAQMVTHVFKSGVPYEQAIHTAGAGCGWGISVQVSMAATDYIEIFAENLGAQTSSIVASSFCAEAI